MDIQSSTKLSSVRQNEYILYSTHAWAAFYVDTFKICQVWYVFEICENGSIKANVWWTSRGWNVSIATVITTWIRIWNNFSTKVPTSFTPKQWHRYGLVGQVGPQMCRIVKSVVGFYRLDFVLLGKESTLNSDKRVGSNLAK